MPRSDAEVFEAAAAERGAPPTHGQLTPQQPQGRKIRQPGHRNISVGATKNSYRPVDK